MFDEIGKDKIRKEKIRKGKGKRKEKENRTQLRVRNNTPPLREIPRINLYISVMQEIGVLDLRDNTVRCVL